MEHLNHPYRAHKMQPWIVIVVGRRGMGKTHTARAICRSWKESRDKDGLILAVDSVSSSPPAAHHLASESDVYSSHMMDIIPEGFGLLAVDEADLWIPESESRKRPVVPLMDMVLRGRHRGCSLLLCSQAPSLIARICWRLADAVIMCSITDSEDLKRLGKLHGMTTEHLRALQTDKKGPRVIWTPSSCDVLP